MPRLLNFSCSAVEKFVCSGKQVDIINIDVTDSYKRNLSILDKHRAQLIRLQVIRLVSPNGKVSVLLSNLFGKADYSAESIIDLYYRHWKVEEHYRNEKTYLDIACFHIPFWKWDSAGIICCSDTVRDCPYYDEYGRS